MTTITLSADEYQTLLAEQQRLTHQLRLMTVERDLLKERVNAFLHRLFAAKSEARANPAQRDLFLNEAEALAPQGVPVAEEVTPEAAAKSAAVNRLTLIYRAKSCAMNYRKSNASAPMTARVWWKSVLKSANNSISSRNRCV